MRNDSNNGFQTSMIKILHHYVNYLIQYLPKIDLINGEWRMQTIKTIYLDFYAHSFNRCNFKDLS